MTRWPSRSTSAPETDFDQAITEFSARYADQNSRDHEAFVQAVEDGRIDAIEGV